jgi:regulator of protease activity HflC (stomatin/prohibitin superfamily)
VQPGAASAGGGESKGSDLAVLAIEVPLHYAIENVEAYERFAPPEMRDDLLKSTAQRELMQYVSTLAVNDLLSSRRNELQTELRRRIEAAFERLNAGVHVLFVGADGVHPPQDTAPAFEQVVAAEQKYQARLKEAQAQRIRTLTAAAGSVETATAIIAELDKLESMPATTNGQTNRQAEEQRLKIRTLIQGAGGRAAAEILEASADRWAKHMGARATLSAYRGQLGTYRAAPGIYRAGLYLDAIRAAMADARVYITDSKKLRVRGNFEDRESVSDIFQSQSTNKDY